MKHPPSSPLGPLGLILSLLLAGCVSAPKVEYFTLDMTASGLAAPPINVVVQRIVTSEALSRPQIMIQVSPTEIDYYATAQWVSDLGGMVRRKLEADLGPPVEGRPTVLVSGTLLAFEQVDRGADADARATVRLDVRPVTEPYGAPLLEHTYNVTRPAAGANPAAVVQALSSCADAIASELAADLARLQLPSGSDAARR